MVLIGGKSKDLHTKLYRLERAEFDFYGVNINS